LIAAADIGFNPIAAAAMPVFRMNVLLSIYKIDISNLR
jgi:hypothetical protein